jgi:predicted dehydrogenase
LLKIAIIGYGYWGPNLARNFSELEGVELSIICDLNPSSIKIAKQRHPFTNCTTDVMDIIRDKKIDAVVIATPPSTHADLAVRLLESGKHVFIEKPLALSTEEAERIIKTAETNNRILCVDHTFVFMGAVRKVKELINLGRLGDLYYYDSVRINLGNFQNDINVAWDLAVHDLSILDFWVTDKPIGVSCLGSAHVKGHPIDVAYITMKYAGDFIAHLHVNWLSPIKIRKTLLAGERQMVVFDDLDATEKIKIYDRGIVVRRDLISEEGRPLTYRRTGDVWIPQFEMTEALRVEAEHFIRCIKLAEKPVVGGYEALQVVRILEAADQSARNNGQIIYFNNR